MNESILHTLVQQLQSFQVSLVTINYGKEREVQNMYICCLRSAIKIVARKIRRVLQLLPYWFLLGMGFRSRIQLVEFWEHQWCSLHECNAICISVEGRRLCTTFCGSASGALILDAIRESTAAVLTPMPTNYIVPRSVEHQKQLDFANMRVGLNVPGWWMPREKHRHVPILRKVYNGFKIVSKEWVSC